MTALITPLLRDPPIPSRYVVQYSVTTCRCCGHTALVSEFFSFSLIHPRNRLGAPVKHFERCSAPLYNLPVDYVTDPPRDIPFCIRCPKIDLSHLPPPPSAAQVYDLAEPASAARPPAKRDAAKAASKPTKPRIEDLA